MNGEKERFSDVILNTKFKCIHIVLDGRHIYPSMKVPVGLVSADSQAPA